MGGPGARRRQPEPPAPDDLRFGELFVPDWVDLARVQVPSADEQQRLLANLIIGMQQRPDAAAALLVPARAA